MKYIIGQQLSTLHYHPIVFDDDVVHADAAKLLPRGCVIIGAGECDPRKRPSVSCFGRSTSLKVGPSALDDLILTLFLRAGLSGLQLSNHLTFAAIQT